MKIIDIPSRSSRFHFCPHDEADFPVFSTAVFGMMGCTFCGSGSMSAAAADLFHHLVCLIGSLCLPFGALGIWRGR